MNLRQKLGNLLFTLLIFLFVIDPTNTIFGLKSIVFVLFFAYNILAFKADYVKIKYFITPVVAIVFSLVFAMMRGEILDYSVVIKECLAFSPLLLLPWIKYYDVLNLLRLPVILALLLVLSLFWIIYFIPPFEHQVYAFMLAHDHTIMMSRRAFLGVNVFVMYYKSTVAFLPLFGVTVYNAFCREKTRWFSFLLVGLFVHYFLISGTRSSILFPLLLLLVIIFIFKRNGRYLRYLMYTSVVVACLSIILLFAILLLETGEYSNAVKYAHLQSYAELFAEYPEYLLFGQGSGSAFYSSGFRSMTMDCEWSYLEFIRKYGAFSLLMFYVYLAPIVLLCKLSNKDKGLVVLLAYVTYIIVAGTNPLLLSSTGMLVLLTVYSFIEREKQKINVEND